MVRRSVEVTVSQAADEVSAMSLNRSSDIYALDVSYEDRLKYNESRERWLEQVLAWAEDEQKRATLRRNACPLELAITNSGGATAEDVEVTIAVNSNESPGRLRTADILTPTNRPEPPERPSIIIRMPALPRESLRGLTRATAPQVWWLRRPLPRSC